MAIRLSVRVCDLIQPGSARRRSNRNRECGFSMVELVVVVALIIIISAMALFALQPALQDARFDAAMREVVDQLRQATEYSITTHRYVQLPVVLSAGLTNYEVQMTQLNAVPFGPGGANTVLSTVSIQRPATFYVFPAPAPDTPDGYGASASIVFEEFNNGPPGGMMFQSDGEFVDKATFNPSTGLCSWDNSEKAHLLGQLQFWVARGESVGGREPAWDGFNFGDWNNAVNEKSARKKRVHFA